ncbi:MAG: TolB family protein [Prolixibacteraceae bacterium]
MNKACIVILTVILITGCEKSDFGFFRKNSGIAFISKRTPDSPEWSLMSMNFDGSEQKEITSLSTRCQKPVVSNSGKMLLFVHLSEDFFYELYSVNIDGSNLFLIDRADRYCGLADWSNDDSKIIYSKNRDESTDEKQLILYDFFSKEKKVMASEGDNSCATFSAGNKIAWCRRTSSGCDIYVMDINGNNKKAIVSDAWNPVWSPDGKRIIYQSAIENGSSQIFIANADGSDKKQLTSSWSSRIWPGWPPDGNGEPVWTPDGKLIIYVSWEDEDPDIYSMKPDGNGKRKLTDTDKRDENPVVTRDGKYILFTSKRNPAMNAEIFVMTRDGKNQKPITNHYSSDIYPVEINF